MKLGTAREGPHIKYKLPHMTFITRTLHSALRACLKKREQAEDEEVLEDEVLFYSVMVF